ncbi:hypothetical protein Pla144_32140 [Bythopirellula polymerisocia]|uniref:Uncharacterized protein n=1 Tax=Bythopirellula polymerisocia TaxID=2528003 RepID=A0A5C6CTD3_9BACT|nr:hypothetical protein Pla144_32140 [Bythopirellula polymerisocia]
MLSPVLLFACGGFVLYCTLDILRSVSGAPYESK